MSDFARIPGYRDSYPNSTYDGQEDQSFGFLETYKLMTGRSRGENRVSGSYIVNDDTVDRLFMGKDPVSNDVKIKLSQPTIDVREATDDQLIWSSDFNNLKVAKILTKSRSVNNVGVIGASYDHELDFVPSFLAYSWSNDPADNNNTYFATGAAPMGASSYGVATSANSTQVSVSWIGGSVTTYTANIKIYLYRETAQ